MEKQKRDYITITDTRSGVQRTVSRRSWELVKDKSAFVLGSVNIQPTVKVNADEYAEFLRFKQAEKANVKQLPPVEAEMRIPETKEPPQPKKTIDLTQSVAPAVKEPPKTAKEKVMSQLDEKSIPYDPTWTMAKLKGLL